MHAFSHQKGEPFSHYILFIALILSELGCTFPLKEKKTLTPKAFLYCQVDFSKASKEEQNHGNKPQTDKNDSKIDKRKILDKQKCLNLIQNHYKKTERDLETFS